MTHQGIRDMIKKCSLVECEHPVAHAGPPCYDKVYTPETSMMFVCPFHYVLVSSIAEWSIGTELTIAELIVATLGHIEVYGTASSNNPFALTITERPNLRVTTATPFVHFTSMKINVSRIDTCICWHAWWSVFSFLVWTAFVKVDNLLLREVRHIIH